MPEDPQAQRERRIEKRGDEARDSFDQRTKERIAAARREREQHRLPSAVRSKEQIREDALEKFWPMAEEVVARALRGEEVNREQLTAAFKVLEQQLGKPGQQNEDPNKDKPSVIVYESAALTPLVNK